MTDTPRIVLGLAGYARSGKDTFGARLVDNHGFSKVEFGGEVMAVLLAIDPWIPLATDQPPAPTGHPSPRPGHGWWRAGPKHTGPTAPAAPDPTAVDVPPITGARLSALYADHGYEDTKAIPEVRTLMQNLGSAINDRDEAFWARLVLANAPAGTNLVISGCRSQAQARAIRDVGGHIAWLERAGCEPINGHRNETGLAAADCDLIITNNGTIDDLHAKADQLLTDIT